MSNPTYSMQICNTQIYYIQTCKFQPVHCEINLQKNYGARLTLGELLVQLNKQTVTPQMS